MSLQRVNFNKQVVSKNLILIAVNFDLFYISSIPDTLNRSNNLNTFKHDLKPHLSNEFKINF